MFLATLPLHQVPHRPLKWDSGSFSVKCISNFYSLSCSWAGAPPSWNPFAPKGFEKIMPPGREHLKLKQTCGTDLNGPGRNWVGDEIWFVRFSAPAWILHYWGVKPALNPGWGDVVGAMVRWLHNSRGYDEGKLNFVWWLIMGGGGRQRLIKD